jgi:UDP-N-acetylmuramyl pentapeptide synthase
MKALFYSLLARLSKRIIRKYKPVIIAITGSVGKTSTRQAIFHIVSQKYKTGTSARSFNDKLGLPLSIIGYGEYPGKSVMGWLSVFTKATALALFRLPYPRVMVLEMGVDRPGEMDVLISIAPPHIAVITDISVSHYEFFESLDTIEKEKGKLAAAVPADGWVIYNADNERVVNQVQNIDAQKLAYSSKNQADISVIQKMEEWEPRVQTQIQVAVGEGNQSILLKAVGQTHVSAVLAALGVARALRIESDLVEKGVAHYKPYPGRLNIIDGIKHTLIIDDSYNASPVSTIESLRLLARVPAVLRMAVLGDMRELGSLSDQAHKDIGKLVHQLGIARLVTVGESGVLIAEGAKDAGMARESIISFATSEEAKRVVQEMLEPNAAILVKGSQFVRMEKITKEIMAEPMRAQELLCRQYGGWLTK